MNKVPKPLILFIVGIFNNGSAKEIIAVLNKYHLFFAKKVSLLKINHTQLQTTLGIRSLELYNLSWFFIFINFL